MWSQAVEMLEQADRMHRQFFRHVGSVQAPRWEPPVDVYHSGEEILVVVALPGVAPERVELSVQGEELVVRAERALPRRAVGAAIQRLEIPYGLFERRLALPPGTYDLMAQEFTNGCLHLLLARR
jgi:HSP20 family molecular chaperone IbpA